MEERHLLSSPTYPPLPSVFKHRHREFFLSSHSTIGSDRSSHPRPSIYHDHKRHPFAAVYITSQSTTLHLEHQSSTSLHSSHTTFSLRAYLPGPLKFAELPSSHTVIALARPFNVVRKFQSTNSTLGLPERLPSSRLTLRARWQGPNTQFCVIARN
jgi:hypothetical protein